MTKLRNSLRWPAIARILLFLGAVGAFLAGGDLASNYLIESQRQRQLEEFGEIALRRSETAVDYGVSALQDFARNGNLGCDGGALQALRLYLYRSGAMKDIRVLRPDGSIVCAAFSETLEFDRGWVTRDDMLPTAGRGSMLFRVEQFFGTALGAMIDVNDDYSLAGIMGADGALLDVMPDELRDHSSVALELSNGLTIAQTLSDHADMEENSHRLAITSERYPLQSVIRVERSALAEWNQEPYLPIMLLSGILGALFGFLLARGLLRPRTPLEELDRAIAQGQICPYFQPIFDLRSGAITGTEMLARWVRPDGTVTPPARFIELAEETGRIPALTWHLLKTALSDMHALLSANEDFTLSVNISPSHFVSDGFVEQLRGTVAAAGVSPAQIILELTERQSFQDLGLAAEIVAEVRAYGFSVAIDDVGIGHSGLSQIQRLRADMLKIDKFFIDSVTIDPAATTMIDTLVRLARDMDMRIVAEGIEDREQAAVLLGCGITSGQGYVVSPPLAPHAFLGLVSHNTARREAGADRAVRAA